MNSALLNKPILSRPSGIRWWKEWKEKKGPTDASWIPHTCTSPKQSPCFFLSFLLWGVGGGGGWGGGWNAVALIRTVLSRSWLNALCEVIWHVLASDCLWPFLSTCKACTFRIEHVSECIRALHFSKWKKLHVVGVVGGGGGGGVSWLRKKLPQ